MNEWWGLFFLSFSDPSIDGNVIDFMGAFAQFSSEQGTVQEVN